MFESLFTKQQEIDVINIKGLTQKFKNHSGEFVLFDNFDFVIPDITNQGQFTSIIGKSGCGKSQLLKIISGLNKPDAGEVYIYGKKKDSNMNIPMVFQQYSSFPWLTVLDNVAFPLTLKKVPKKERYKKAFEILDLVGLTEHAHKWCQYPILSGGQLQRVSIARNLLTNSQIMLLDEATSALDLNTKREMQKILLDIYYSSKLDPTFINVTHDISEAVLLSNRIIILDANPCRIHTTLEIEFDGRRTQDLRTTTKFNEYVSKVETIMNHLNS